MDAIGHPTTKLILRTLGRTDVAEPWPDVLSGMNVNLACVSVGMAVRPKLISPFRLDAVDRSQSPSRIPSSFHAQDRFRRIACHSGTWSGLRGRCIRRGQQRRRGGMCAQVCISPPRGVNRLIRSECAGEVCWSLMPTAATALQRLSPMKNAAQMSGVRLLIQITYECPDQDSNLEPTD